ncbi:hypothetical protein SD235_18275 (plasmid) [Burkholderia cepacia]|uniref:hypothetical protein n=2 Tax=Burkholderia cepacia TaxID=292 RepID=UPI003A4DAFA4
MQRNSGKACGMSSTQVARVSADPVALRIAERHVQPDSLMIGADLRRIRGFLPLHATAEVDRRHALDHGQNRNRRLDRRLQVGDRLR